MRNWIVIDDGTLDTVLKCPDCGMVLRFTPEDLSLADCIAIADEDHACEVDNAR